MYKLSDFDYQLPQGLIAQSPVRPRDSSRLLVFDRAKKAIQHHRFRDIVGFFRKGDVLVLNDTKVMPARLLGHRRTGGKVEVLLLGQIDRSRRYHALIKPLARLKEGEEIILNGGFSCELVDARKKIVEFKGVEPAFVMQKAGLTPLPPYIRRTPDPLDIRRYQTVFARNEGAVAAPTAGLHFTKRLLATLKKRGVKVVFLTLHVNYATFSPVRSDDIRGHKMSAEYFQISASTMASIVKAKKEKRRIFAVGTTVAKALEDGWRRKEKGKARARLAAWSRLFIFPPFSFKVVDALITNFHLPRTSLLMLVSAFAGRRPILEVYKEAMSHQYRFYSYGDAMLIL